MKKVLIATTLAAISLSAAAVSFGGSTAGTGITQSSHDMNFVVPGTDPYQRVCAYCHTPHHAIKDATGQADYLPLWSRNLTSLPPTPYTSASFDKLGLTVDPLYGPSRLCMSCHDGAIAVDQHYDMPGVTGANSIRPNNGFAADGSGTKGGIAIYQNGDLTGTHPIGFQYDEAYAATTYNGTQHDLNDKTTPFTSNPRGKTIADALTDGYMTCATCHDVHNKDNVSLGNYNFFLYAPQEGSALCLSCHNK